MSTRPRTSTECGVGSLWEGVQPSQAPSAGSDIPSLCLTPFGVLPRMGLSEPCSPETCPRRVAGCESCSAVQCEERAPRVCSSDQRGPDPSHAELILGTHISQVMGAHLSSKDGFESNCPFLLWGLLPPEQRHVGSGLTQDEIRTLTFRALPLDQGMKCKHFP